MFPSKLDLQAADVLVSTDAPWQAELRLRQARWRERLRKPAGTNGGRVLGSRLPAEDRTSNFLTPTVAEAVEAAKAQPDAMVSVPRIYDNLLSSQPLAFNLFGELAQDGDLATSVGKALWPDILAVVDHVHFEWSPGRNDRQYLGNRSAFDVALLGRDATGARTLVGIEVKYHENMTQDPGRTANDRYAEVAAASGVFRNPEHLDLRALPLRQVWLDHLLALSMVGDRLTGVTRARFVLLAPAINPAVVAVDVAYRAHLADALTYERRTLEDLVTVLGTCTDAGWVRDFEQRYLKPTSPAI